MALADEGRNSRGISKDELTNWKSQRTQMIISGVGCILLGIYFGVYFGKVGISGRFVFNNHYPPNPLVGLGFGGFGVSLGLVVLWYALRKKTTKGGTAS